jgi:hypothetical protein
VRLLLDALTNLDRGLRCLEEGSGAEVGSTTQWDTMVRCSHDNHAGGGVVMMTVRAVVIVGCGVNSR